MIETDIEKLSRLANALERAGRIHRRFQTPTHFDGM
jgi:hypothetical protein